MSTALELRASYLTAT